jgi:DNA-binding CsgD family transcriptional regulator
MGFSLDDARGAFARQAWREACVAYESAATALDGVDHERHAIAAYLIGDDGRCTRAWEAAHRAALDSGDTGAAARAAALLALCLVMRGQMAQAGGWMARAEALLEESGVACSASGYVLVLKLLGALDADPSAAAELAVTAMGIAKEFDDRDLGALAVLGHAQASIRLGETQAGRARLDDVMLSAAGGNVGPVVTGIVYCAVIIECLTVYDLERAAEWTDALGDWCDVQPDLVPYRGQCFVHRAQLHQAAGRWADALSVAEAACRHLANPPHPALGLAHYQHGEVHRLAGNFDRAEVAYRAAIGCGFDPVPGLALLELARDDAPAAVATISRVLDETTDRRLRPPLLAAAADILRAAGDVGGARRAADELVELAAGSGAVALRAMASHALGSVLVAEGDLVAALNELRAAARAWQALQMPYEAACTATTIGLACAAVGDLTAAGLELDRARTTFRALGARPDLDRLAALGDLVGDQHGGSPFSERAELSARETDVLAQLATGKTNREIAEALLISPHTANRHVENIFAKLGVRTRAAATAYAYEHSLLTGR